MIQSSLRLFLLALLLASPASAKQNHVRRNHQKDAAAPEAEIKKSSKTPSHSRVRGIKETPRDLQVQKEEKQPKEGEATEGPDDEDTDAPFETEAPTEIAKNAKLEAGDTGIIGGMNAVSGEFPFMVKFEGGTLCGGALISPDTILTAAHCVDSGTPSQVRIGPTSYYGGNLVSTQCSVMHPDFIENKSTLMNDVAIIKLKNPINVEGSTIEYNKDPAYPSTAGTKLNVIGFGLTWNDGQVAQVLQKLQTSFVTNSNCVETYSANVVNSEDHICADIKSAGGMLFCWVSSWGSFWLICLLRDC